ncbi:IS66 family transposase, partial [Paenibacillus ginsengihumi]|uniref:IS66 family transposase n=1 Tax=Paenibacillus ginsengihumi TaxID=431596 RepID=UPI0003829679
INLLLESKAVAQSAEAWTTETISRLAARYDRILEVGRLEDAKHNPPVEQPVGKRGKPKQSKPKNLLDRLQTHRLSVLTFLCNPSVPFDNNQAERDIRMMKVQQKISGTFRSEQGAKVFCRIRSFISTAKKQSLSIIDALERAFRKQPVLQ